MAIHTSICEDIVNLLRDKESGNIRHFYKNGDMSMTLVTGLGIRDACIAFLMYEVMQNRDFSVFRAAFPGFSLGDLDNLDAKSLYEWLGNYVDSQNTFGPILDAEYGSKIVCENGNVTGFYGPVTVSNEVLAPRSKFVYLSVYDFYY